MFTKKRRRRRRPGGVIDIQVGGTNPNPTLLANSTIGNATVLTLPYLTMRGRHFTA